MHFGSVSKNWNASMSPDGYVQLSGHAGDTEQ